MAVLSDGDSSPYAGPTQARLLSQGELADQALLVPDLAWMVEI